MPAFPRGWKSALQGIHFNRGFVLMLAVLSEVVGGVDSRFRGNDGDGALVATASANAAWRHGVGEAIGCEGTNANAVISAQAEIHSA